MNEQELKKTLLNVFKQEANERLLSMTNCLIAIESKQGSEAAADILKTIYREAHSIKGASRSIGLSSIEQLFQAIESVFFEMINGKLQSIPELFDTLITICKELRQIVISDKIETEANDSTIHNFSSSLSLILSGKAKQSPTAPQEKLKTPSLADDKKQEPAIEKKEAPVSKPEKPQTQESSDVSTVRIDSAKLDKLLRNSENLIVIKQFFSHKQPIISDMSSDIGNGVKKIDKMLIDFKFIESHASTVDAFAHADLCKTKTIEIEKSLSALRTSIYDTHKKMQSLLSSEKEDHRFTSNLIDEFLNGLKEIAMVPISNFTGILPIMTREIAQKLEKKLSIEISGDLMMLDRRILDAIKDPLIHLIRNSIDHGIETPIQRKKLNKPEVGLIKVSIISSDSNYLEISISDDGSGINLSKLKKKLIEKNLAKEEEVLVMNEERLISYIFAHGFSTSDIITDLSGRGLGLSIVKENVELIGGSVNVSTCEGNGSTFSIRLPITMATYKGIIVKVADCLFVLPSVGTEIITRVLSSEVNSIENRLAVTYDKHILPLVSLSGILGLKSSFSVKDKKNIVAAILGKGTEQVALLIEEVLEEKEIILKDLGRNISKVPFISGVTVFSSGEIIPVLNIRDIIKHSSSSFSSSISSVSSKTSDESKRKKKKRILIAEDSPTSRTLIKNVLEAAGFEVVTTNDGQEALTYLRTNKVDLLVSDIEMPRMNGFDLTRKVRTDEKFKELPVILVTSLSSREDMERGIEAGANSYIIKSQFDQSLLIETVKSLL